MTFWTDAIRTLSRRSAKHQQQLKTATSDSKMAAIVYEANCSAPNLSQDIEDAHLRAVRTGCQKYSDPATGYEVETEATLGHSRAICCGNGCRHCPYGHYRVQAPRSRINTIRTPTLLRPASQSPVPSDASLVLWQPNQLPPVGVWLVAFDVQTQRVWGHEGVALGTVMDASLEQGAPLVAVPLTHGCDWSTPGLVDAVHAAGRSVLRQHRGR